MTERAVDGIRMGSARGRWVLATTVLGSGLTMLDSTVVNVALERMGQDFGAGFSGLQWTINAYALTLAALILLGGSLGDRFGRRRVFLVGVVWFALASLLCGVAPSIGTLIAARALQGIGGALLMPGSLALISASFHGEDRAAAVGAWSGLGGVAAAIGPLLGGWLADIDWRLVFLVNVPVAVVVVVVALRYVPESRDPESAERVDLAGTLLGAAGLGALTFALTRAGDVGWTASVLAIGAVGVALLVGFVLVERASDHPMVPLGLFSDARFSAANGVTLLVYAALGVIFVLLVLQLQVVAGWSPLAAGTAMLPVTALMLLFGAGLTLLVAPLTATVLDAAADRYAGTASGINNAVARTAGLIAVAVVPVAAGIGGADYRDASAFDAGFGRAMLISAVLLLGGAALAFAFVRRPLAAPEPELPHLEHRLHIEDCPHCGVAGPQLHPADHQH
jgi:MFS family permease